MDPNLMNKGGVPINRTRKHELVVWQHVIGMQRHRPATTKQFCIISLASNSPVNILPLSRNHSWLPIDAPEKTEASNSLVDFWIRDFLDLEEPECLHPGNCCFLSG